MYDVIGESYQVYFKHPIYDFKLCMYIIQYNTVCVCVCENVLIITFANFKYCLQTEDYHVSHY